jgi:hypothetical protein
MRVRTTLNSFMTMSPTTGIVFQFLLCTILFTGSTSTLHLYGEQKTTVDRPNFPIFQYLFSMPPLSPSVIPQGTRDIRTYAAFQSNFSHSDLVFYPAFSVLSGAQIRIGVQINEVRNSQDSDILKIAGQNETVESVGYTAQERHLLLICKRSEWDQVNHQYHHHPYR